MPSVRLSMGRHGPVRLGLAWAGVYWRRTDVGTTPGGQYEELDCLHLGGIARVASGSSTAQKGPVLASTIEVPVSYNPTKSKDAFEGEETEQSKRNRDFKALEKCEKNGGVGMLLRCLWVIGTVTFLSELNQRHLPELQLPRRKRDAPVSFIGLVSSTINMLAGRDELHLVNKH
ncbi:unnamed protein product [Sphagnum balticum]